MRVNVYTEELTHEAEVVSTEYVNKRTGKPMTNYGLRIFCKTHPDLHFLPSDDDRSAVTFWCGPDKTQIEALIGALINARGLSGD